MSQVWTYIQSDYYRHTGKVLSPFNLFMKAMFECNYGFRYTFWLRLASKLNTCTIFRKISVLLLRYYSVKYGVYIPSCTKIGYGFYIGHAVGIVINGRTQIGNNVNIGQFLSIGSNKGTPAIIGDNVYIGPHVSIVEDVKIGNESCIGAGAVVIKDVPEGVTVVGCPAHIIGENKHRNYVGKRWNIDR